MPITSKRLGFFNAKLEHRMNELGLSARELADRVPATYEHIRKLLAGCCLPSDSMLEKLCDALNLNKKEICRRVQKDRLIFRFGDSVWQAAGIDSRAAPFYILFPLLNPDERSHFLFCIKAVVEGKRSTNVERSAVTHPKARLY
jgi:Helix-turn-helix domain